MKVLGLKDFDQRISPLSLTFHWTRVFSSRFFSSSLSQSYFLYLSIFSLFPANLQLLQKHSYTYHISTKICMGFLNVLHLEIFLRIMSSMLFSDRLALVSDRPVYKVSSVLSVFLHSSLWESQHCMLKDARFHVRLLQITQYPCLLV